MSKRMLLVICALAVMGVSLLYTARLWAENTPPSTTAQEETWPEWNDAENKIVPIVSVGTPGVRLGAAQIAGPKARVESVKVVMQLDAEFKNIGRLKIFVPSSELLGLNRVQGVAVMRLLDYRFMKL